jgi:Endonuclease-reverse transcriptase
MNLDATEFFPSNEIETRSTTIDDEDLLFTMLKTNYQLKTAQSILHEWNTATTLSALTHEWSRRHESLPTDQASFSLVLYNISSLRMHLEDLISYISVSYPNIWALTGLHFNDDANYQLASYFKSRYTIYYQHGSNNFGGVCLAIAREIPHRVASEFNNINNLIAADVFNSNKKYTVAVIYSPPSEEVPIDILNRLHRYNRNLILIGDLNARHINWHDVTSNSCGQRLVEWIDEKQNLKIFNSSQPTSTRSRAVIDLIIAPSHVSSALAEIDQTMCASDHYPVHWRLSSFNSHSRTEYQLKRIDWVMLNCILTLKQNFFFALSAQMRHQSNEFILVYEAFLVALQERCTTYHMTKSYRPSLPPYLVNIIKQRRRILWLYRSTRLAAHRYCLYSLNKYIHHELRAVKRAQWQEFCLGLEPKNTQRFWNHSKKLFRERATPIQGFLDDRN